MACVLRRLRLACRGIKLSIMSSVLEIEKAIESLPTVAMLEVAEWLDMQRAMVAAAESTFQMLDEEEGNPVAEQWLG